MKMSYLGFSNEEWQMANVIHLKPGIMIDQDQQLTLSEGFIGNCQNFGQKLNLRYIHVLLWTFNI